MANDPEAVERWVDERLHALDPGNDVRPDVARARRRLRQLEGDAPAGSRRAWLVALATVVLIAIVLMLIDAGLDPWASALIVGGVALLVGAGILAAGVQQIRETELAPKQTAETVRENVEFVKEQVK